MSEGAFKQFRRLGNQLVVALDKFGREENLAPVLIPTLSKHMDEQDKLAHKAVEVSGSSKQKNLCDSALVKFRQARDFMAHVGFSARNKENEKFQQVVHVNYIVDEFIYLLDVMNSVYDKLITVKLICNIP